jgi:hypothetical protein
VIEKENQPRMEANEREFGVMLRSGGEDAKTGIVRMQKLKEPERVRACDKVAQIKPH